MAHVCHVAHDFIVLFNEPREDAAGVETTAVCCIGSELSSEGLRVLKLTKANLPSELVFVKQLKLAAMSHLFFSHIEVLLGSD